MGKIFPSNPNRSRFANWSRRIRRALENFGASIRGCTRTLGISLLLFLRRTRRRARRASTQIARRRAVLWSRLYAAHYRRVLWQRRFGPIAVAIILAALIVFSTYWLPLLQASLEPYFKNEPQVAALRAFLVQLGGSLIGAVAIVSSLVLFAMQVNIERMPHGLFRRLSADRKLLGAFAATFLLAISIVSLSLIPDVQWVGVAVLAALWGTALILALFLYGYRRALLLVNPVSQLNIVIRRTQRDLRRWARRAMRAAPLLEAARGTPRSQRNAVQPDLARTAFFQANPGWTAVALQAVRYAISFAQRYAEQGDHEVSATALNAVIAINSTYVEVKGRTFFAYQLMLDNPLTTDGFINDTLEHLRQTARIALARSDEQQLEQTLYAMAALAGVYARIDYASTHAPKTHAHLAAGYLAGEIERIVPHSMPDVLMEGVRLMGQCADVLLSNEGPQGATTLIQKIGLISCAGVAREDYRPVTSTGVEQLARLSFDLLRTRSREIRFAAQEIRSSMKLIAQLCMTLPDTPLTNVHSACLAPYYSATSTQSLAVRLTGIVNAVSDAVADDVNARQVIENFIEWTDRMHETERNLFLLAIEKRSQFTFEMIHWITTITTMLIALSNAEACDHRLRRSLRNRASQIFAVLSWAPSDEAAVRFLETFRMTERFFESAVDAHNRNCAELENDFGKLLLAWTFKAGRYSTGWATLERSVYGLATLALLSSDPDAVTRLKAELASRLAAGGLPDKEVRDSAALEIRDRAGSLYRADHWSSAIEQGMLQTDHSKMKALLEEIADMISPETKGQAANNI